MSSRCIPAWKRLRAGWDSFGPGRRPRLGGSMPPWRPDAASVDRYAALRVTRWPGRCADTQRASRGASRVIFVSIGVRPEEERRPYRLWLIGCFSRQPEFAIFVVFANAWLHLRRNRIAASGDSCIRWISEV